MQRNPETPSILFHGVSTSLPVTRRPPNTAAKCTNFRILPGFTLRLRSGRKARHYLGKTARKILGYRDPALPGSNVHLVQLVDSSNVVTMNAFTTEPNVYSYAPTAIETINTTHDAIFYPEDSVTLSFSIRNPVACCLLSDRPLYYNGLGVRGTDSKPPFSTYYGGVVRFFGLDAYCPLAHPTAVFSAGAGYNGVETRIQIYVGIYNAGTNHYSNGVFAGEIEATSGTGTITVSNLNNLPIAAHGGAELSELSYVFYATNDGAAPYARFGAQNSVPYLILNADLSGPFTVPNSVTSASLSISNSPLDINGFPLNLAAEMPYKNYPPRPMRSIASVNGRLYGALLMGGSGGALDFTYIPSFRELAAVVWSAAPADIQRWNSIGDPLECWPTLNIAYTPSSDCPVVVMPAQDSVHVLVLTPSSTFLLQEIANGIHDWIPVSRIFGCGYVSSAVRTQYGICWVTQNKHIVMLPPSSTQLVDLSADYASLITGNVTAADYLFDAANKIDRYQIWMDDGTSVIHDFALGGEGYDATGYTGVTAAATVLDAGNHVHHIMAASGFYTHEAQPEDGRILTTDETYTSPTTTSTADVPDGEYRANWTAEGDSDVRKDLVNVDLMGDVEPSALLSGMCPASLEWYADFEEVNGTNKKTMPGIRPPQTLRNYWRFKPGMGHRFWYKFVLKLKGHRADDASFAKFPEVAGDGDSAKNFYGSIIEGRKLYENAINRK